MKIEEQRQVIENGLRGKLNAYRIHLAECAMLRVEPHTNEHLEGILAFLTEKGAVLRSHWSDCKAPPSGKAFTTVIDGVHGVADCGCPNTVPLMEKK